MAEMIRINTRVSPQMMAWLDERTKTTGIPKSTLIMLAIEDYKRQSEAMAAMTDMALMIQKLEGIEQKLARIEE